MSHICLLLYGKKQFQKIDKRICFKYRFFKYLKIHMCKLKLDQDID